MTKLWTPANPQSDKVILIHNNIIYKGNPSKDVLIVIPTEAQAETLSKSLFGIPYTYIKKIENQEDVPYLKIHFGRGSEEELHLSHTPLKNEIFNYLKDDIPYLNYRKFLPNILVYAKTQIIGITVATILFLWALYYAIEMANGVEYELVGGRPGITAFVFALANFGIKNIFIGYFIILGITLLSFVKRIRTRSEMEILERK